MAGGTRLHRWIYEASLGRDERSIRFRKEENGPPAVRKLSVSLDRADNVIEGGLIFESVSPAIDTACPHTYSVAQASAAAAKLLPGQKAHPSWEPFVTALAS